MRACSTIKFAKLQRLVNEIVSYQWLEHVCIVYTFPSDNNNGTIEFQTEHFSSVMSTLNNVYMRREAECDEKCAPSKSETVRSCLIRIICSSARQWVFHAATFEYIYKMKSIFRTALICVYAKFTVKFIAKNFFRLSTP